MNNGPFVRVAIALIGVPALFFFSGHLIWYYAKENRGFVPVDLFDLWLLIACLAIGVVAICTMGTWHWAVRLVGSVAYVVGMGLVLLWIGIFVSCANAGCKLA